MGLMWVAALLTLVLLNDLGSALMFFAIFMTMLYLVSGRALYVVVGVGTFALACFGAWKAFSRVELRVQNWLDPWKDPFVAGYQPIQSDYALASGGLFGKGFAQGSPWFIPAVETDYIFSAIGEELGLLGTLALLTMFLLLVVRGFLIAMRVEDGFAQMVAAGLTAIIGFQTIIIVGGVLRVIPLTGITLPFISYGGSSLLSSFALVGILLHISSLPKRI
jgi:cell division protein FtsW (lipid II flippase)